LQTEKDRAFPAVQPRPRQSGEIPWCAVVWTRRDNAGESPAEQLLEVVNVV
jgi:hypothetical protein